MCKAYQQCSNPHSAHVHWCDIARFNCVCKVGRYSPDFCAVSVRSIAHITRCTSSSLPSLQFLGGLFQEKRNFGHCQRTVQSRNRRSCHVGWTLGSIRNAKVDRRPCWKWREQSSSCPSLSRLTMKRSVWLEC
jgi:hypothetical protein